MWKFILSESERHFNMLLCFLFHEKILSGSKFTISGFPLRIVKLSWIDVDVGLVTLNSKCYIS